MRTQIESQPLGKLSENSIIVTVPGSQKEIFLACHFVYLTFEHTALLSNNNKLIRIQSFPPHCTGSLQCVGAQFWTRPNGSPSWRICMTSKGVGHNHYLVEPTWGRRLERVIREPAMDPSTSLRWLLPTEKTRRNVFFSSLKFFLLFPFWL